MSPAFRSGDEREPPPATPVAPGAITRFDHLYEVDPQLMTAFVPQQPFPNWDTQRIAAGRLDHLDWMHRHFAGTVVPASELLGD